MPEVPDLVHIVRLLAPALEGKRVLSAAVEEPVVLRLLVPGDFRAELAGRRLGRLSRRGPFLRLPLEEAEGDRPPLDLVMHLMLTGRLRLGPPTGKKLAWRAFALELEEGQTLEYGDETKMGKVYLTPSGRFEAIPGYLSQGVDVLSEAFTWEAFVRATQKKRNQVRALIMDQSLFSAIGNAYADEILFAAGLHPKAPFCTLGPEDRRRLYESIKEVLAWGIAEVEAADRPAEEKVRGHVRVRNRAGEPCPVCGTTIRKAGVLGFDAFFCPRCQPDRTGRGLDWNRLPPSPPGSSASPAGGRG